MQSEVFENFFVFYSDFVFRDSYHDARRKNQRIKEKSRKNIKGCLIDTLNMYMREAKDKYVLCMKFGAGLFVSRI